MTWFGYSVMKGVFAIWYPAMPANDVQALPLTAAEPEQHPTVFVALLTKRRQLGDEAGPLASMGRMVAVLVEVKDRARNGLLDIVGDRGAVVVAGGSVDKQAGHVNPWQN
jgi:hypothetical protein